MSWWSWPPTSGGFLVSTLSATGGHLGSNLGVVELTLALHRAFRSPDDAIVWDTGHQAYVHKLVTGRAGVFATLRQAGGLSGYPNRTESTHDLVENSHASTGLSYAYGLAAARTAGRGSPPGGGGGGRRVPHRGPGVRGPQQHRGHPDPGDHRAERQRTLLCPDGVAVDHRAGRGRGPRRRRTRHLLRIARDHLSRARSTGTMSPPSTTPCSVADATLGPVVVHVHTVKGRGYRPAEQDDGEVPPRRRAVRPRHRGLPATPVIELHRGLRPGWSSRPASATPRWWPSPRRWAARPACSASTARFPDRYFDVGIAEQHAVTTATGMALGGLRPVVAIYSTFLNRAWDQLLFDVALHRAPIVFCIDRAGVTGDDGPSHHGIFDLVLLTKVPGLTVFAPSSYRRARGDAGRGAGVAGPVGHPLAEDGGPHHRRGRARVARPPAAVGSRPGAGGAAHRPDVCLLGVGKMVAACQEAADRLEGRGLGVTVWDVRVASPLDPTMVEDAARHTLVLTAEDGIADGGVGASIATGVERAARGRAMVGDAGPLTVT